MEKDFNYQITCKFIEEEVFPELEKLEDYYQRKEQREYMKAGYKYSIDDAMAEITIEISPLTLNFTKDIIYIVLSKSDNLEETKKEIIKIFDKFNKLVQKIILKQ